VQQEFVWLLSGVVNRVGLTIDARDFSDFSFVDHWQVSTLVLQRGVFQMSRINSAS